MKAALVTGASSGVGRACAARLGRHGWRVYAAVRRPGDGHRLVEDLGGEIVPVILDVTHEDQASAVVDRIAKEVDGLDAVVNNAGIAGGGPVELIGAEAWRRVFDVNVHGAVTMTRETFPLVRAATGRFVHIGSIAGRVGGPGLAPYVASKHALMGFNWSLRQELRGTGMHSSLIEPGNVATEIWAKGGPTLDRLDRELTGAARRRYAGLLDTLRGFLEEGATRCIDPDRVAAVVERALTVRRPKARYLVGSDAKVVGLMSRLPDRVVEAMVARNAERLRKAGHRPE